MHQKILNNTLNLQTSIMTSHWSSSDFITLRVVQCKFSQCTQHPPYLLRCKSKHLLHTYAILLSNITIVCPVTLLSIACHAVPLTSALKIFLTSLQIFLDIQNANCIFTKQYKLIYYKHVVPKCCSKMKYSTYLICRIESCILFTHGWKQLAKEG